MQNSRLKQWCEIATCRIGFPPDRKKVSKELMDHLEDHRDILLEQGLDEDEATEKALKAMGDAKEIAPQLGAIHRPFWGYLLRYSRIAMIVLLFLCLLTVGKYVKNLKLQEAPDLWDFELYSAESYGGDTGRMLLHLSQPELTFSCDGHHFTITDACVMSQDSTYYGPNFTQLHIRMKQSSILPCQVQDEFFTGSFATAASNFIARDSLGNEYPSFFARVKEDANCLISCTVSSGIFTFTHELWINQFPQEAEWVDICYERDGRSYCLRIYLDGGEAV